MNRDALIRALWQPPPEHDPTDEEILARCMWLERTEKLEANQGPTLEWYRRLEAIIAEVREETLQRPRQSFGYLMPDAQGALGALDEVVRRWKEER